LVILVNSPQQDPESLLFISLMEQLAATLPAPAISMKHDALEMDLTYLVGLPIKQACSLLCSMEARGETRGQHHVAGNCNQICH
jgi:hypothetical protein